MKKSNPNRVYCFFDRSLCIVKRYRCCKYNLFSYVIFKF